MIDLMFYVEYSFHGAREGVVIRVVNLLDTELLRFSCFDSGPELVVVPDRTVAITASVSSAVEWALEQIEFNLQFWLSCAGYMGSVPAVSLGSTVSLIRNAVAEVSEETQVAEVGG